MGPLTWELCDRADQSVLATLDDRLPGAKVDITRHAPRSAQLGLALSDAASAQVVEGTTLLRCKVEDWTDPLFVGRVSQRQIVFDGEQEVMQVSALDPWAHLARCVVNQGASLQTVALGFPFEDYETFYQFSSQEQADIMSDLISSASDNGHGIVSGSTPSSFTRDLSFPFGSAIADAVLSVVQLLGGPEFELTPTEAGDGTLSTFNIYYPRQGSDKSATVELKIGVDDTDNLTGATYTPALNELVNKHTVVGDVVGAALGPGGTVLYPTHPAYEASHAASIAEYGVWEGTESLAGSTDGGLLQASAQAMVAANAYPIDELAVTLDPDTAPDFNPDGDFWIGDTVAIELGLPQETISVDHKVTGATITEDEDGIPDVDVVLEPDAFSGVSGTARRVVVDAADGLTPPPPEPAGKGHKKHKKKRKKQKGHR